MGYSQYFLVGSDIVYHGIAEFLTCPVNLKMFILFRNHFFGMPYRQRVNARRKLCFGFGMIQSNLDAPHSKGDSVVKMIVSKM